jgi:hypothetical protein
VGQPDLEGVDALAIRGGAAATLGLGGRPPRAGSKVGHRSATIRQPRGLSAASVVQQRTSKKGPVLGVVPGTDKSMGPPIYPCAKAWDPVSYFGHVAAHRSRWVAASSFGRGVERAFAPRRRRLGRRATCRVTINKLTLATEAGRNRRAAGGEGREIERDSQSLVESMAIKISLKWALALGNFGTPLADRDDRFAASTAPRWARRW